MKDFRQATSSHWISRCDLFLDQLNYNHNAPVKRCSMNLKPSKMSFQGALQGTDQSQFHVEFA